MKITLIEAFFGGSHRQWAEGYRRHSRHQMQLLTLPGRHWKWRMHGAAVTLGRQLSTRSPGLILASDMIDLTTLLALLPRHQGRPVTAMYFHENQITYPWSPADADVELQRNHHYGFINYTSALAADRVFFNSLYHRRAFLEALPAFLKQFPDYQETENIARIEQKSAVLPLGLDLQSLDIDLLPEKPEAAVLLWNHRWEYDKDPETFFRLLFRLHEEAIPFYLIVLGESFQNRPAIFEEARRRLATRILHFGYADSRETYARLLWQADILPVTSRQDFFGGSSVEAIYCNCYPLLPRRLAFPAHVPEADRGEHLYDTDEELYRKLKLAIKKITSIRRQGGYRHFVAHYDWRRMAGVYDEELKLMNS